MNLGPTELIIILAFLLPVWGIIDAALRPNSAWQAADQSKVLWIVLIIVLWFIGALVYLIAIRPKVKAAEGSAGYRP